MYDIPERAELIKAIEQKAGKSLAEIRDHSFCDWRREIEANTGKELEVRSLSRTFAGDVKVLRLVSRSQVAAQLDKSLARYDRAGEDW
jgi:hypothetical protein